MRGRGPRARGLFLARCPWELGPGPVAGPGRGAGPLGGNGGRAGVPLQPSLAVAGQERAGPDLPDLVGLEGSAGSGRISGAGEEQAGARDRPGSVAVPRGCEPGFPPAGGCSPWGRQERPGLSWERTVAPVPVGLKSRETPDPIPALEHFYFPLGNGV